MCQAKPGNRCSPDMLQKLERSKAELVKAMSKEGNSPEISDERNRLYNKTREALRQWYETPDGIKALRDSDQDNEAMAFIAAREYRSQSLKTVESQKVGGLVTVPTKGLANCITEIDEDAGTFQTTIRRENADTGQMETVPLRGVHASGQRGKIYTSQALGAIRARDHIQGEQFITGQMMKKYGSEHTFIDHRGAAMQTNLRIEEEYDRALNALPAHRTASESLDRGYIHLRDATKNSSESGVASANIEIQEANLQLEIASAPLGNAEGKIDMLNNMSNALSQHKTKEGVIKAISNAEPQLSAPQYGRAGRYSEGFEAMRLQLLREASNYNF